MTRKSDVADVRATQTFHRDFLTVRKGLRLPADHALVAAVPELFEEAPELPASSRVVAIQAARTHGRSIRVGEEFRANDEIVEAAPHFFASAALSDEERRALSVFRTTERAAPQRRADAEEERARVRARRRALAERRLEEARVDFENAEAELGRIG